MSSLGKGIAAASIGALLQARGYSISMKKLDPYINVHPGLLNPQKHGEVYVMADGCEADLDFGHYERFTGIECTGNDSLTTGKVYANVLEKERNGEYNGSDVQVIPHITNEIKEFIKKGSEKVDFTICEIGGTVGDIEGLPYIEALRQLTIELGKSKIMCIHLTYLPYIKTAGELKTKPTQHSVKQLQSMGVQPDIILCRSEVDVTKEVASKLSMFCNVKPENVIAALDAEDICFIPEQYHKAGLDRQICEHFGILESKNEDVVEDQVRNRWGILKERIKNPKHNIKIAIVGRHEEMKDVYLSLTQAVNHAGYANDTCVHINWIHPDSKISDIERVLNKSKGLIIPDDFNKNDVAAKLFAIKWARETNTPFLGIGHGMHLAVIEAIRNFLGLEDATSPEISDDGTFVITQLSSMQGISETRRIGNRDVSLLEGTLASRIYRVAKVTERHRQSCAVDLKVCDQMLKRVDIRISGTSENCTIPEIIEKGDHPFYIGTQYIPEFKSRHFEPHPVFQAFIHQC